MRFLLFISMWVLGFTQSIQAQNIQNTIPPIEQFVQERIKEPIPDELLRIKAARAEEHLEGSTIVMSIEELQKRIRRGYWEREYFVEYGDALKEERKAKRKNGNLNRSANGPVNNPDLTTNCAMSIVVVIDRSGSINGTEPNDIRTGLNNFVANMVGTGNIVTFVGMGEDGGGATFSPPVAYSPGDPIIHNTFINGLTFSGNNDSWSSALTVAAAFNPDLVLIIADGDDGHGNGEAAATCQAANILKNSGAHLFVFGQGNPDFPDWISGSLVGAVTNAIDPNPVSANNPPTMPSISTTDFIDFGNNFGQLSNWLSVINPGVGDVEITNIWPRSCILNNFTISGTFDVCDPLTATSFVLRFFNSNGQSVTVPATLNNDGTWTFTSTLSAMTSLGLSHGTWYDVEPILTLSDGTVITGIDFIAGQNNDLFFADQSDPLVIVNDDPNDFNTSMTTFCVGSPIFYHGTDPLSSNHFSSIRRMGPNDPTWTDNMTFGWVGSSLDGFTGNLNAQYPGYFIPGFDYQLTIASHNPERCIAWTTTTVEFNVVSSQVNTTSIWPRTCVRNNFSMNGNFNTCAPLTAAGVQLEFWQNGAFTGVAVPATVNANGTWTFSSTLSTMVGLGLEYGTWYDVIPVLSLSDGTTVTGPEFIAGQNNDLYFADQSDPIVIVNDDPNDFTNSMTTFCVGSPIFYHGTDPQSSNHFSSIRRKGPTDPDWTDYMAVEWVGSSLDGFTGDLNAQYPGYFEAGFTYQLAIASHNPAECLAWTLRLVEFEVIDCCEPDWMLTDVPECVNEGEEITVTLTINAPLDLDDIESIYSSYNNYTYISHTLIDHGERVELIITFLNRKCTCEGERLVFDIVLRDCETPPIWVMTDPIPCCLYECDFAKIVDWNADEECILFNGDPARNFCIDVVSELPILDVFEGSNGATCQVDLHNLQITPGANDVYTICGVMRFLDPNCTFHATVSLLLETENTCCEISQGFSFPSGCVIDEACQKVTPDMQLVYISNGTTVNVSLDLPFGETVTVIDHYANTTQTAVVQKVLCPPFAFDSNGNIIGGNACNGITFWGPQGIDCQSREGAVNGYPYFLEIQWGKCTWILTGNYCDELLIYTPTSKGTNEKGSKERTAEIDNAFQDHPSGSIKVFPNPIQATDLLNFDLSKAGQAVEQIMITNTHGRLVESIVPTEGQEIFQHRLQRALPNGIYLVVFQLADGTVRSSKLVAIE